MAEPLLSEATLTAIVQLCDHVDSRHVAAEMRAVGIPWMEAEGHTAYDNLGSWYESAPFWRSLRRSFSLLDLSDSDSAQDTLKFATRIVEYYVASSHKDRSPLIRLKNALMDDGYELSAKDERMAGYSIDRRTIARMAQEMQKEFDKHPIEVPVSADPSISSSGTNNYYGPVFHGDANGAQLAWGNESATQIQNVRTEQVAPGFEAVALAIAKTLEGLPALGLNDEDRRDAEVAANTALAEITQTEPDRGKIRAAVQALKGVLAPVMAGLVAGSADGAQEWARTAIEQLTGAV